MEIILPELKPELEWIGGRAIQKVPPVAPDIVVEIFSPGDLRVHINEKRRVYLAAGVRLLLHVDPKRQRVDAYRPERSHEIVSLDAPYAPPEFPGLSLPFGSLFKELER